MRTGQWLGASGVLGVLVAVGLSACGSGDSGKSVRPCSGNQCAGDAGDAGSSEVGGAAAAGGSTLAGGAGSGGSLASDAGAAGVVAEAGSSSDAGATGAGTAGAGDAGAAGAPPAFVCPAGTADCDGDGIDCETNIATDASNCGRCERKCGGTAQCTTGWCQATVILDPPTGVSSNWCGAAFTATTAYMVTCWGNSDLSEVRTAPLEPGADVFGTRIRHYTNVSVVALRGIVIDGNDVFYGLQGAPSNLWKFPLNATGTNDVSVGLQFENNIRFDDLQLIGDTYYWETNTHTVPGQIAPSTLYKRKKGDVASTPLFALPGLSYDLTVTPTRLVWLESRTAGNVRVYRAPAAGGTVTDAKEVAIATPSSYLVKQGEYAYWTVKSAAPNGRVVRLKIEDDTAVPEDVVTGLNLPEGLESDAGYLYFKQADALYRAPITGGKAEQLSVVVPAHDAQATQIFHVNEKYVYFAAGAGFGDSTLVRVAK